jgi:transposase-like protein
MVGLGVKRDGSKELLSFQLAHSESESLVVRVFE